MKFLVLLGVCLVGVFARPSPQQVDSAPAPSPAALLPTPVPIIINERTPIDAFGGFGFRYQTGDGTTWVEQAVPAGPLNQVTRTGQIRYMLQDGTPFLMTYTAGVNGFQPISDHIPTPHPLEPWHIEQIEFAARQKAAAAAAAAQEAAAGGTVAV